MTGPSGEPGRERGVRQTQLSGWGGGPGRPGVDGEFRSARTSPAVTSAPGRQQGARGLSKAGMPPVFPGQGNSISDELSLYPSDDDDLLPPWERRCPG